MFKISLTFAKVYKYVDYKCLLKIPYFALDFSLKVYDRLHESHL